MLRSQKRPTSSFLYTRTEGSKRERQQTKNPIAREVSQRKVTVEDRHRTAAASPQLQLPRRARLPSGCRSPAQPHRTRATTARGTWAPREEGCPRGGPAGALPQQPSTASSWDSHACRDAGLSPACHLSPVCLAQVSHDRIRAIWEVSRAECLSIRPYPAGVSALPQI